ncbi:poly-gamma-glutamate synthesis protein (capsule biosynthesis protein) [Actinomadura madurae]|uniref:Poly-gamma-glutamate synthesis protein (Capsule biosynthesis protein) n=1 Tax=Actinomadura madurae TaxID=1993 RepID=A0A1I5GMA4_9ACTN|nr:poly-gamma-glutamate synthesis protein (capsule biosynthesis protein) [Actinomadura madurae]
MSSVTPPDGPSIATNVDDDFTLAAAGDLLSPGTVAVHERNRELVRLLRSADATVANFEAPAIDLREPGHEPVGGGPGWPLVSVPAELPRFLKGWGFDMVGFANNHAVDWGPKGARETIRLLDAAGICSAGFGETRAAARAPAFFASPKGRVALVAFTATFRESSAAMDALGLTPAVPGVSALHTTPIDIVTREQFGVLREIETQHSAGGYRFSAPPGGDELRFRGNLFRVGDKPGTVFQINPDDEIDILRSIREAKQRANFLVVSVHNHEEPSSENPVRSGDGSAWPSQEPPDFLQTMARAAIDNGADAVIGHGPHVLLGIEIYNGRPIFYSLGDLFGGFEQVDLLADTVPAGFDAKRETVAEYWEQWWAYYAGDRTVYQSVIAESRFRGNRLAEVRLHPVDLGQQRRLADRGYPETPSPAEALSILQRLQRLSEPFGTKISIEGRVGVIRLS